MAMNKNITIKIIKENIGNPLWKWDYISYNPNITWKFVKDNLDKPWSWTRLSFNPWS
jgi:hypothetical protein